MRRPSPVVLLLALLCAAAWSLAPLRAQGIGCTHGAGPESVFAGQPWPAGTVPYAFDASVTPLQQGALRAAMLEIEAVANVRFVPRTTEADHLLVRASTIDSSAVGRSGGPQLLHVASWGQRFVMVHSLLHALGFWHEHQRPDRDQFVQVQQQNVDPLRAHDFQIVPTGNTQGSAYDFDSLLHFAAAEGSGNAQPTLVVLAPNQQWQGQIGQRTHLSQGDRRGLRLAYGSAVPPTLTALSPPSVPSAQPGAIVATGLLLDEVTSVLLNGVQVPFTVLGETQLRFSPQPNQILGPLPVTVVSRTGASNALPLTFTGSPVPLLTMPGILLRGAFQNQVRIATDLGLQNFLLVSAVDQPTLLPGVLSLGIGAQFTSLAVALGPLQGDARGIVNATLTVPLTVPGQTRLWFQAIAFDPLAPVLPLPASLAASALCW